MPTEKIVYQAICMVHALNDEKANSVRVKTDTVPKGSMMRYMKNITDTAFVLPRKRTIMDKITEGDEFTLPELQLTKEEIQRAKETVLKFLKDNKQSYELLLSINREKETFGLALIEF